MSDTIKFTSEYIERYYLKLRLYFQLNKIEINHLQIFALIITRKLALHEALPFQEFNNAHPSMTWEEAYFEFTRQPDIIVQLANIDKTCKNHPFY